MALAARGVVVVGVRGFANQPVDVGPDGDVLIGQLGIVAVFVGAGLDDLLLFVGDLQGIGPGVLSVVEQVGDGQHRPHQDLFIILARIAAGVVVGEHRGRDFAGAELFEVIEIVADLA